MNHTQMLAAQLDIRQEQVSAAIELLDAQNTIPFIARYRKEATGVLDEEQLRQISDGLQKLRALDERRATVLRTIDEQGKLTAELSLQIEQASTLAILEDLYLPYKPKRRTRAMIAHEKGLQPLADAIIEQARSQLSLDQIAQSFLNEAVHTFADVWAGAGDIVAETISDHPEVRRTLRQKALSRAVLHCEKLDQALDPRHVFELYYEFECRIDRLKPYQVLAINRGETEKVLRVRLVVLESDWRSSIQAVFQPNPALGAGRKVASCQRRCC